MFSDLTTKTRMRNLLIIVLSLSFFSFDLPAGWFKAGSQPKSYEMGIDKGAGMDGGNAATIRSIEKKINGFGTLMQTCSSSKYLGKRVRMTGKMKTKDVEEWSGIWFRVDEKNSDKPLAFDNMHEGKTDRSIKGTTDWKSYEIVLDVPVNAYELAFGALLVGTGQIWFDNVAFEIVDTSVPITGSGNEMLKQINEPVNLDFEK